MSELVSSISAIIAACSVIVASAFAIKQIRNADRSRKTEFVFKLQSVFLNKEYMEAWATVRDKPHSTHKDCMKILPELELVCAFFDTLGVLMAKKLVEPGMLLDIFGTTTIRAWENCRTYVMGARKSINDPKLNFAFELLYKEALKDQGLESLVVSNEKENLKQRRASEQGRIQTSMLDGGSVR